ncbi:filamentous hemagglutinin N-terminal domain-containing protein [Oscillatoriales cyanobacterium LEGE 11467]|uniref:Filamentous hemagglutinin N-terminal domain-containing protein n=1 Tax=Zarconia navalis LEGE 11467 TaxID=1828826 RepID=A0A928VVZ2_9CYAN|nr:filamentous hemagglutinin N-terminal domain-containing protein [Zarconia navalis]MBE9040293.1 filamentous hemagglutinin N-terminal domain-containing protein [Zarconia navalis LEGE 11467]
MVRLSMVFWVMGGAIVAPYPLLAQIVPDTTLPENSIVNIEGELQRITGGTAAGGNLFHSFEQFNVRTGETARFETSPTIDNIITRITGGQTSNIDGLIQANPTANLFLLNPQGILFGANARLDVGGSFVATSASSIDFADGSEFSATPDGETAPLLTVSVPVGLQFNAPNPGDISVTGADLVVPTRETLALIGGNVAISAGRLVAGGRSFEEAQTTPAGRIELGSVREGSVNFTPGDRGLSFDYATGSDFGNIQLLDRTRIDLIGTGGGDLQMVARNLQMNNSVVFNTTLGSLPGGNIIVRTTESVEIMGTGDFSLALPDLTADPNSRTIPLSGLLNFTFGAGNTGAIVVETPQLVARNNASILSGMQGESTGSAGGLTINASEQVEVASSLVGSVTGGNTTGDAGAVVLSTPQLLLRDNGLLLSSTFGSGSGGDIIVEADEIRLIRAQPLQLNPFVTLGTAISSSTIEDGEGGNITIDTGTLELRDGALITTGAIGSGSAGSVTVNASEEANFRGANTVEAVGANLAFNTGITVGSITGGDSGDLRLTTPRLILRDGAFIAANTFGEGAGGSIEIEADVVKLSGMAPDGGTRTNISANSVGFFGAGKAGNLEIRADEIQLDRGAQLIVTSTAGEQGNIILNTNTLQMRNGSQISTDATETATGGNININTDTFVTLENSDITANAQVSSGGQVQISAQGIFGTAFREELTNESDITAISFQGTDGTVTIQTPDIDPSRGLVNLTSDILDPDAALARSCLTPSTRQRGRFSIVGGGGLPPKPYDPVDLPFSTYRIPTIAQANPPEETESEPEAIEAIVEAEGIFQLEDEDFVLGRLCGSSSGSRSHF